MSKTSLQPGENAVASWTLFYTPPGGKKFNGKLTVTNQRLIYRTLYDAGYNPASYHVTFSKEDKDIIYSISKADISNVASHKSFLANKVIVTLTDGTIHEFNRGMMGIDKLINAINN